MRTGPLLAVVLLCGLPRLAHADSSVCDSLAQGAAAGIAATVQADDATISKPRSVTSLTCLDNFFKGIGLDVLTSGLDPASLFNNVAGKICQQAVDAWQSSIGSAQCGLTITGYNTGFNLGLGGGSFCPKLSFGGGDGTLTSISGGNSSNDGLYVDGRRQLPDGYDSFGEQQ